MPCFELIPECYADTFFIDSIFKEKGDEVNHAFGISQVSVSLENGHFKELIKIGFIDNDKKNVPPYFNNFEIVDESDNISFKKHKENNIYVFVLKPAIEMFLINEIQSIGKSIEEFNLPIDLKSLKKQLKKTHVAENENYQNLISFLRNNKTIGCEFIRTHLQKLRTS
ncbi:MAG: hypothetical protein U0V72_02360 [Cytophagales bacterium]